MTSFLAWRPEADATKIGVRSNSSNNHNLTQGETSPLPFSASDPPPLASSSSSADVGGDGGTDYEAGFWACLAFLLLLTVILLYR